MVTVVQLCKNLLEIEVTAPSTESTTVPTYIPQEIVTVPVIADPEETLRYEGLGVEPNYNIQDNMPTEIGSGKSVSFLLIFFTVVMISGVVVFLTLARKKEEEFEEALDLY